MEHSQGGAGTAAGRLALEFANALVGRGPAGASWDYRALVAWARRAGALSVTQARRLLARARREPAVAARTLGQARTLGRAIDTVVSAVIDRRPPPSAALAAINRALTAACGHPHIARQGGSLAWEWEGAASGVEQALSGVARSAAHVLTSGALARVRRCAAPECRRLFLDATRNQTRRWCDMATCGNRAKARRFYARRFRTGTGGSGGGRSARGRRAGTRTRRGARARPRP